jgi:hypothetical protein
VGGEVGLATDGDNLPHMVFSDSDTDQVRYVHIVCHFILCGWSFETIDQGLTPTMKRAPDGRIHVAYWRGSTTRYALRTCSGDTCAWTLQAVGSSGIGMFPGLALTASGSPYISFVRPSVHFGDELILATRGHFGWNLFVADEDASSTGNSSIAIDSTGHPRISYHGQSDNSLRHTKGTAIPPPILEATF